MADLFATLRAFSSVERVSNLYGASNPLHLHFFLCPKIKNKGLCLRKVGMGSGKVVTGLRVAYDVGPAKSTEERLARVERFLQEALAGGVGVRVQAIFAVADAMLLFSLPVPLPPPPEAESALLARMGLRTKVGATLTVNTEAVEQHRALFTQFYEEQPWRSVPERVRREEEDRLVQMLPEGTPDYIREDFVRRTFAGFALDGMLLRSGAFGRDPVILGVESSGVPILQNAALPREQWLPVIQLR